MQYQYVVILKRDSNRSIDRISILLCIFSALNFLFEAIQSRPFHYFLFFAGILILGGVLFTIFSSGKSGRRDGPERGQVRYKYWLLIAALGWLGMPYLQWLSIFFFALTFLEYQAKYPLEIGFTPDRVVINTLFKKSFGWEAFNNIILKDGLLTMDFKNNRLLQKEVVDDEEGEAEEDEFNDFCMQNLRSFFMEIIRPCILPAKDCLCTLFPCL